MSDTLDARNPAITQGMEVDIGQVAAHAMALSLDAFGGE